MPKADKQATEARKFKDPDSFVFKDGREWLEGEDWDARRFELLKRCGGRCEYEILPGGPSDAPVERCRTEAHHPHHFIKKSVAHDDRLANLMALCETHHRKMHPEKQIQKLTKGLTEKRLPACADNFDLLEVPQVWLDNIVFLLRELPDKPEEEVSEED